MLLAGRLKTPGDASRGMRRHGPALPGARGRRARRDPEAAEALKRAEKDDEILANGVWRYMEEQFEKQQRLLSELQSQLRFVVREEASHRLESFQVEQVEEKQVVDDTATDFCWDPAMREKLKEHKRHALDMARWGAQHLR